MPAPAHKNTKKHVNNTNSNPSTLSMSVLYTHIRTNMHAHTGAYTTVCTHNYKYSVDRGPLFLSFSLSLARAHERARSPFLSLPPALCLSQPLSLLLRSLSPHSFPVFHFPSPLPPLSCSLCSFYRFSLISSRIAPVE